MDAAEVAALLGLEPLPHEGGLWAQTWIDDRSTAIYFLMQPGDFSAMHRLDGPEIWHHYAGAPVRMVLLHDDGMITRPILGDDLAAGERPCVIVPKGDWMGAESLGEWSLVGTTMAPPYTADGFELGERGLLTDAYPGAAGDIARLTREEPA
jgi:predicted cupin superfamily sugar epimerase